MDPEAVNDGVLAERTQTRTLRVPAGARAWMAVRAGRTVRTHVAEASSRDEQGHGRFSREGALSRPRTALLRAGEAVA